MELNERKITFKMFRLLGRSKGTESATECHRAGDIPGSELMSLWEDGDVVWKARERKGKSRILKNIIYMVKGRGKFIKEMFRSIKWIENKRKKKKGSL